MIRILFLAANPSNTSKIRLCEEYNLLAQRLQQDRCAENIALNFEWAVSLTSIYQAIAAIRPDIVHFTGHGSHNDEGIQLQDATGQNNNDTLKMLAQMMGSFHKLECVILDACYLEAQANIIAEHVHYLIGTHAAISHNRAIEFSSAFYRALSKGTSILFAYQAGCSFIYRTGTFINDRPVLKIRGNSQENSQNNIYGFILHTLIHLYNYHRYGAGKQGEPEMFQSFVHLIISLLLPSITGSRANPNNREAHYNFQNSQHLSDYGLFDSLLGSEHKQDMTNSANWIHIVSKFKGIFLEYANLYHEFSQHNTNEATRDDEEEAMLYQEASSIENFFKNWNITNIQALEDDNSDSALDDISADEEELIKNELAQITKGLKDLDIRPAKIDTEKQKLVDALNDYLDAAWQAQNDESRKAQPTPVDRQDYYPDQPFGDDRIGHEALLNCIRVIAMIEGSKSIPDQVKVSATWRYLLELRLKDDSKRNKSARFQHGLSNLVIGNHNDPIRRLVERSLKNTPNFFNPLIIYGGAGLGKTTLLKSMANTYSNQGYTVLYCPSSQFITDVNLGKEGSVGELLLEIYKKVDIFLFDDLRPLEDKKKAQRKLGELIEHFVEHDRQVIVTSDALPIRLNLEEMLINQLERGVPLRVEEPNVDTKLSLLKSMMNTNHSLSEDVLRQIAEQSGSNIRELEGALKFISAQIELGKETNVTTALETWKQERRDAKHKGAKASDATIQAN